MHGCAILSVVCAAIASSGESRTAAANETLITFDDIKLNAGIGDVPFPYHHLRFSSYSAFKPHDPVFKGVISEHDLNCATSFPNALLGSRPSENAGGAYFEIANATNMKEQAHLYPYFTLSSFFIKPMDAPAPGTTIYVKGYSKKEEQPLVWHVDFPSGYHLPFQVKLQEYSGEAWDELYKVEILADFGYDALDWEFCIDDLVVQYFALPDHSFVNMPKIQSVQHDGYVLGLQENLP